ncbi:GNAT family N-acetyltransferase [Oceanobacillus massiliensis]|uniref:GNAT family N-acetyltransferase n=1 Tax=Oceanobacillus massiliensis TaxID=1465765 RepID=UPI0002886D2C|nr:GNAT family N-acetyltransferase [Oceanobacillus massiliensis]
MKISETKDYKLVAALNKHVHDLHYHLYPRYFNKYNEELFKEIFKELVEDTGFTFLLLENGGEAVGYAWIEMRDYPESPLKKGYKSVYVHQISINASKRNQGYGTALMEHIYKLAKNCGIDLVELDYWLENTVAKEFYEKHKFVRYREMVYKEL